MRNKHVYHGIARLEAHEYAIGQQAVHVSDLNYKALIW